MKAACAVVWTMLLATLGAIAAAKEPDGSAWEGAIARFESLDRKSMPAPGGIVFVGSSSIRLWDTKESFPELAITNRGFGGSQASDVLEFADRIVIKYRPRLIAFYAGDNDLAAGETPQQVLADFRAFTDKVFAALPETKILFLAIKPSPARIQLLDTQERANRLIEEYCQQAPRLTFVDLAAVLLDDQGLPIDKYYAPDRLHLSAAGYEAWTKALRPLLK